MIRTTPLRSLVATAAALGLVALAPACSTSSSSKKSSGTEKAKSSAQERGAADGQISNCSTLAEDDESSSESSPDSSSQAPFEATGPIATIDDRKVPASYFNDEIASRSQLQGLPRGAAVRFKKKLVRKAVDQHLIESELDNSSTTVSQKEVEKEYQTVQERFPDDQTFQAFLKRRGLTEADLRVKICRDVKLKRHIRDNYDVEVTDEEVKSHYEANKKRFSEPEKVKASHILVKVEKDASEDNVKKAKKKAESLAKKAAKSDTEFAKLAEEHSDGPSASRGGDLGYFSRKRMVPAFSDAAFSAEPGKIVGPIRTRFGFHVIKVHDKKTATTKSLEDVRSSIKQKLSRRRLRRSVEQYLKKLRDEHSIEYQFDNVKVTAQKKSGSQGVRRKLKKKLQKKMQEKKKKRPSQSGGQPDESSGEAPSTQEDDTSGADNQ